jgi:hypothetical protein
VAAKVGTGRILYGTGTISFQDAVHPKCTLGALNMKEGEQFLLVLFTYKLNTRLNSVSHLKIKEKNNIQTIILFVVFKTVQFGLLC